MNDKAAIVLAIAIFSLFMVMALLKSLNGQVGVAPPPTGNPNQHFGVGCIFVMLMLVGIAIVLASKG